MNIDGFYSAYLTARSGHSLALLAFDRGAIAGADAFGGRFDGSYRESSDEGSVDSELRVTIPPNSTLLQGQEVGPEGATYEVRVSLPPRFWERDFVRIETPYGPVNATMRKLRGLRDEL